MFKVGDEVYVNYCKNSTWNRTGIITQVDEKTGIYIVNGGGFTEEYLIPIEIYESPLYKAMNENEET